MYGQKNQSKWSIIIPSIILPCLSERSSKSIKVIRDVPILTKASIICIFPSIPDSRQFPKRAAW